MLIHYNSVKAAQMLKA